MIGIIVAAGKAKRMGNKCKALIRVKGKPIIEYIIQNMIPIVKKIIIIQHGNEIEKAIGNGYLNIPLIYVQQKRRKGIAHAIYQCKRVKEDMLIILGDIIYFGDLTDMKKTFEELKLKFLFGTQNIIDKSLLKKSYGITYMEEKRCRVIEKPTDKDLKNMQNLLGLGIYMATPKLFDYIKKTKKNEKTKEIEFTDTINEVPANLCGTTDLNSFYININTEQDLKDCEENL